LLAFAIVCSSVLALRYRQQHKNAQNYLIPCIWFSALVVSFGVGHGWHLSVSVVFGVVTVVLSVPFFFLQQAPVAGAKGFKCPLVPLTPLMGIYINLFFMSQLSTATWLRFLVWLSIGFFIYFVYSMRHSKLNTALYPSFTHLDSEELELPNATSTDTNVDNDTDADHDTDTQPLKLEPVQ
jgi:hypothetical protein